MTYIHVVNFVLAVTTAAVIACIFAVGERLLDAMEYDDLDEIEFGDDDDD